MKEARGHIKMLNDPCCTLLTATDVKPLRGWRKTSRSGHISRIHDAEINSRVLEVIGANTSKTLVSCPADPSVSLGVKLPVMVMIVKNLHKYFAFEVSVLDSTMTERTFRASTAQGKARVNSDLCTMPMKLDEGWNKVQVDLAALTMKAFKTQYAETVRVTVHVNCRVQAVCFVSSLGLCRGSCVDK
jgi:hypothetical protein